MKTYKAPERISETEGKLIFLAGTIDMGHSVNWQQETEKFFAGKNCTILNPRRDDWDETWQQKADNKQFAEQVNWELDAMEKADIIVMNFLPGSQSPVSLLELGLFAASGKLVVCCPDDYWRRGNVEIVCRKYGIPFFENIHHLLSSI